MDLEAKKPTVKDGIFRITAEGLSRRDAQPGVSRPLDIDVSDLAKAQIRTAEEQIRTAEEWWRVNRPKAPNAIHEELERAASIISVQPEAGARALNIPTARRPMGTPPGSLTHAARRRSSWSRVSRRRSLVASRSRSCHPRSQL
jgi:hypothetical protein